MRRPTRPRTVAVTALVLAAVETIEGVRYLGDVPYLSVLLFIAALLGTVASLKLWRKDGFESRFTIALIALFTVFGHALALTAGLPGSTVNAWSGSRGAVGFLSLVTAIIVLAMLLPGFFSKHTRAGPPI